MFSTIAERADSVKNAGLSPAKWASLQEFEEAAARVVKQGGGCCAVKIFLTQNGYTAVDLLYCGRCFTSVAIRSREHRCQLSFDHVARRCVRQFFCDRFCYEASWKAGQMFPAISKVPPDGRKLQATPSIGAAPLMKLSPLAKLRAIGTSG